MGKGWPPDKKMTPNTVSGPEALFAFVSEADFTRMVVDLAQTCGWLVYHSRPGRTKTGWVTPMMGNKGFNDILALKGSRQVVAELKSQDAPGPTAEQIEWQDAFRRVWAEVYNWRPSDWETIVEILGEGRIS